ncbi:MAG: septal ring factor EnvC (AmiA/AmiB activator) [Alphaproteobacteria bacterium]
MLNWWVHFKKHTSKKQTRLKIFSGCFLLCIALPTGHAFGNDNPTSELSDVRENIAKIQPEVKRLSNRRSLLEREKVNLSERLVIITDKVRSTQERIGVLEDEIKNADMREQALTADLSSRKAETAKILAAMGRLSLSPSPPLGAVDDEEKSVHTAMILRNLTSELKKRADSLVADLKLLRSMREELKKNRRTLAKEQLVLDSDSERLKILVETRQNHISKADEDLKDTQKELLTLSKKEKTIEGLIEKINLENKRKLQKQKALELAKIEQAKKTADLLRSKDNTSPKIVQNQATKSLKHHNANVKLLSNKQFIALKGKLSRPVSGKLVHQYAMADKTGKKRDGITIQSKSGAIITSPVTAKVIFADNFKRQGSIIILNPAGKYYIVLSGLSVINVSPGQSIAMGEPIGRMASGIGQRNLYVEFRKDTRTMNPNKWLSHTTKTHLASSR